MNIYKIYKHKQNINAKKHKQEKNQLQIVLTDNKIKKIEK